MRISPEWLKHIKVQAAMRGMTAKDLVLSALTKFIGAPVRSK